MSFHTDYRPAAFSDFIGNSNLVESLQSLLKKETHPRTYLFSGPSGCGKTTLARIVANTIGAKEVIEINSSNNRGIDTAREILSTTSLLPLQGKNKVYILDEIHQATKDFQNALLKALEEPPSHCYFILCTTEPDKLLETIRKRCTQFVVEKIQDQRLSRYLYRIAKKNQKEISLPVLKEIVQESEGCIRQALIMLEKCLDVLGDERQIEIIRETRVAESKVIDLCRILLKANQNDWPKIAEILKGLEEDPEKIRRAVLGYMSSVLLNGGLNKSAAVVIEAFSKNYYDSGKAGLILSCVNAIV